MLAPLEPFAVFEPFRVALDTGATPAPNPCANWILSTGYWDSSKVWINDCLWINEAD
jgi:hypothetical protein